MQINSCIRLPQDSFTAKICRGKWQERYSLSSDNSCLQNIKAVVARIFIALTLLLTVAVDLCVWSLRTITIIPAWNRGQEHGKNLISLLAMAILSITIPCGYNPRALKIKSHDPLTPAIKLPANIPNQPPPQVPSVPANIQVARSLDELFDSVEAEVFAWAESYRVKGLKPPNLRFVEYRILLGNNSWVNCYDSLMCNYGLPPISDRDLEKILIYFGKLLFAGFDLNYGHARNCLFRLVRHLLYYQNSSSLKLIKFLIRRRYYEHYPIINLNLNKLFNIYFLKGKKAEKKEDTTTLLSQLLTHPVFEIGLNSNGLTSRAVEIAIELLKHGATVNLDFQKYQEDWSQLIKNLSIFWPTGFESGDLSMSIDIEGEVWRALSKYTIDENYYIYLLGKIIINQLNLCRNSRQKLNVLYNTLNFTRTYIPHLIANKPKFEQARNEWLAKRASWMAERFYPHLAPCGFPPPLMSLVADYADPY